MSESKEVIVVHCDCGRSNHHNSNSHSLSRNPNSRSVQSRSDDSGGKVLATLGGAAIGAGLVLLLAAWLGDD